MSSVAGCIPRRYARWSDDALSIAVTPARPGAGRRRRYRASAESVREAFHDYREEILWLVGEDDRAVSFVRGSGTHLGSLQGMEPTGRRAEWHAMGALRFADGQALERWGIGDSFAMMQQLGVFG